MSRDLNRLPRYRRRHKASKHHDERDGSNAFTRFAPAGHFYSPLPDLTFVERHSATLFDRRPTEIPGIEIHADDQLTLLAHFGEYSAEVPFTDEPSPGLRYYFQNSYFSYGDAIVLYSMLHHRRPRRIVEVGSGFSSAVMLDTNDRYFSQQIDMMFIDPYPERLLSLLTDDDLKRHELITDAVQDVPLERFAQLRAGDLLFVDSSHVVKVGSDVVHLVTVVLPRLAAGVVIHFHDVFWPFEYPEEWIRGGRAWNEIYLLKAFLQFNASFKVLFFNSYIATHHGAAAERHLPLFMKNPGGSLWIEKIA